MQSLSATMQPNSSNLVAGVDLGGTAVNYTFFDGSRFLIEGLCEHQSLATQGPAVCLQQMADGLQMAAERHAVPLKEIGVIGLGTPGPASASGVLSATGSTNFVHPAWSGFDIRGALEEKLGLPAVYINDGNAGALWGHYVLFGAHNQATSISAIIGTGLGGGVIIENRVLKGCHGFGGELGHVLLPYQHIPGLENARPLCNCGRVGDLESVCSLTALEKSLLPAYLPRYPDHELAKLGDLRKAARLVRGLAEKGDPLARQLFAAQAHSLALFFDQMVSTFDPNALIVGGGAIETGAEFQQWFLSQIREAMPVQWKETGEIPIHIMPNGDTAGARGAALEAYKSLPRP
jgi:predicted NBD/HSP70 family sugar kinase